MKTPYKTLAVLALLTVAVALVIAQPAPDQSIKQTAFYQQVMESLQVAGLANPPLYPDGSGTVQGWTNTNALTFTNDLVLQKAIGGGVWIDFPNGLFSGDWAMAGELLFETAPQFGGVAPTTRSNLFGTAGRTTNFQFVHMGSGTNRLTNTLVFSNGALHAITSP
jgi:hypothetical protein